MIRTIRKSAVLALCCAVVGVGLVGCDDDDAHELGIGTHPEADTHLLTGTKKITVSGKSVYVSCSGNTVEDRPAVLLLPGAGDGLDKMAAFQKTLSKKNRVCSYDRLGEGKSDKPDKPQTFASSGKILTAVLDRVAGDNPVVLAGHSLGGLIAARYAPDHQDRVAGLVLMDATPPTMMADLKKAVPESATGPAAQLRDQTLQVFQGKNPEKLAMPDGKVRSAGDMPVEVIRHGKHYLAAGTAYEEPLEQAWAAGERKWLALSDDSTLKTATKSDHYIYVHQPDLAVQAVQRVTARAAGDE